MDDQFSQENNLEFLKKYKTDNEIISLSSGEEVSIQKYFLTFKEWKGTPILNTYGNKAVIDWNGEPVFAELAILRLFQSYGWQGVWVDSYRRKYRIGLPDVIEPVNLSSKQEQLINTIRIGTGKQGGCWDVLLWRGESILFIELKRLKKDRIRVSQINWLEKSLDSGLNENNFMILEWS